MERQTKLAEGLATTVNELKSEVDARWKVRVAENAAWQSQVMERHTKLAEGLATSVTELKSDVDARWKARLAEQTQWEQRKELWMSSFLKDSELANAKLTQSWTRQFDDWKRECAAQQSASEKRSSDAHATLDARLGAELSAMQVSSAQHRSQVGEASSDEKSQLCCLLVLFVYFFSLFNSASTDIV
jgi:hypothetical protein